MYLGILAELRVWQGRLDEARIAIEHGLDRIVGTDEARSARLVCLGMRVAADQAENGRAARSVLALADNDAPPDLTPVFAGRQGPHHADREQRVDPRVPMVATEDRLRSTSQRVDELAA
jgi:hypothetical protein